MLASMQRLMFEAVDVCSWIRSMHIVERFISKKRQDFNDRDKGQLPFFQNLDYFCMGQLLLLFLLFEGMCFTVAMSTCKYRLSPGHACVFCRLMTQD